MNLKKEGRVDGKEIGLANPTIKDGREGRDRSSISGINLQFRPMRTLSPDLEVGSGQAMRTGPYWASYFGGGFQRIGWKHSC